MIKGHILNTTKLRQKLRSGLRSFYITQKANFKGEEPASTCSAQRASTFILPIIRHRAHH